MLFNPVGRHLSELPFVNELAGSQCRTIIHQAFEESEEQNGEDFTTERVVMIHLRTNSAHVLLEMIVSIVIEESERHAVLTGREVDSDLATLMENAGTAVSGASSTVSWASDRCYQPPVLMLNRRTTRSPSLALVEASDLADEINRSDSDSSDPTSTITTAAVHCTDAAAEIANSLAATRANGCGGENALGTKNADGADTTLLERYTEYCRDLELADSSSNTDAATARTDDCATEWRDCESHVRSRGNSD